MKYIITDNSIMVVIQGTTMVADKSHPRFDEIKKTIESGGTEIDIIYLLHKEIIDQAKNLLLKTGGKLTDLER
jgi:hypothetical protein